MVGGRVNVRGGSAWGPLVGDIGVRSLEPYRSENAPHLTWREALNYHKQIREAVNLYRLAHGGTKGTGPPTRIEIRAAVRRVKDNAARVIKSGGKENWLERLAAALDVNPNLLADLYYVMIRQDIDIWSLQSRIVAGKSSATELAAVKVLAEVEINKIVPSRDPPDPLTHGGTKDTGPLTKTEIVEAVNKVKANAAGVIKSGGKENWLERLAEALSVRVNLLANLHSVVIRQGVDIWSLRSRIDAGKFSATELAAVKVLAEVEIYKIVPRPGHPNPPLTRLVRDLTPVWVYVAGSSTYPKNDGYGDKVCPYADWLVSLIEKAGLRPPPENTIPLIIRRQKKPKIKHPG